MNQSEKHRNQWISRQRQLLCSALCLMLLAPWQAGRAGTDALGRKLPVYESTGPPRPNKTLGMFYFQTSDSRGDGPYGN